MTLDLSNSTVNFFLQDSKPEGDLYVKLKSHYNNKYLLDGATDELAVTPIEWYTNWWKGSFTFATADYTDKDIAGFYDFELYADDVLVLTKLTKVINSWKGDQNIYYTGSNENNEQYIMFK